MVDEREAARRLAAASAAITAGVAEVAPGWVIREVRRIADAWGRLEPAVYDRLLTDAETAGHAATARVVAELEALFARRPVEQRATPLQVVRTLVPEPTELLRRAGIPPVERDPIAVRMFPADDYGLTPSGFDALGAPELGPQLLAWGTAKAALVRDQFTRP